MRAILLWSRSTPAPRLISGALPTHDFDLASRWIARNAEPLIDY
jgi:hypothetical protein